MSKQYFVATEKQQNTTSIKMTTSKIDADMQADMANFATYEELATLEAQFNDVDTQVMARQYILSTPLFARRKALIAKVDNFWPIALEQVPESIDQFILPSDSELLNDCLKDITLERFETPETLPTSSDNVDDFGEPRSFRITFHFAMNDWFTNESLTKTFWYRRRTEDEKAYIESFAGLVSEPVKIDWKKDKDLTHGLLNSSCKLFEAQQKAGSGTKASTLPEYEQLCKKIEKASGEAQSFFSFFGYRGPWISAEESAEAKKIARAQAGKSALERSEAESENENENENEDEPPEPEMPEDMETEIFPDGETLAVELADDFFPGAVKYYTMAREADLLSDDDFEDDDEEDEDDEDGDEAVPDLVALVGGKGGKDGRASEQASPGHPPSKKRKT